MRINLAKGLHNQDEVKFKIRDKWLSGKLSGDAYQNPEIPKTVFIDVVSNNGFFYAAIPHKDIR